MKYFILLILVCNLSAVYAQKELPAVKRKIYFFLEDSTLTKLQSLDKHMSYETDSLLIGEVKLIVMKKDAKFDTISCVYKGNAIYFDDFNFSKDKIASVYLSVILNFTKYKNKYDERIDIPYTLFFKETNEYSDIFISFDRKRNNYFEVSISKMDFPFMISDQYIATEIINLYK